MGDIELPTLGRDFGDLTCHIYMYATLPQHASRIILVACIRRFQARRCWPYGRPSVVESVGDGYIFYVLFYT